MLGCRAMGDDRIDFISAYCDRWCERCVCTSRCSAYVCDVAAAMCGDLAQGLELAIGTPHPVDGEPPVREDAGAAAALWNLEMSPEESAAFDRSEATRRVRLDHEKLGTITTAYTMRAWKWLNEHSEALRAAADPVLAEALDVVTHDSVFVSASRTARISPRDLVHSARIR
jgi:hypothetical protein